MMPELLRVLSPIIPIIGDIARVFLQIVATALPPLMVLLDVLMPMFEELAGVLGDFIVDALALLAPVLMDIAMTLAPIIEAAFPLFMKLLETIIPIVLELVEMFLPLLDLILPMLGILLTDVVIPVLTILADVLGVVLPLAMEVFKEVGLGRLIIALGEFADDFALWIYHLRIGWAEGFNEMIGVLEGWINAAIRGLGWFIEKANSLPGVQINFEATEIELSRLEMPGLPASIQRELDASTAWTQDMDLNPWAPDMPGSAGGVIGNPWEPTRQQFTPMFPQPAPFADGGIVKARPGGIIANIGEGNYDEAVIPLRGGMGFGSTYNITVNAGMGTDGARVGEQIVSAIRKYERVSGPVFARA